MEESLELIQGLIFRGRLFMTVIVWNMVLVIRRGDPLGLKVEGNPIYRTYNDSTLVVVS